MNKIIEHLNMVSSTSLITMRLFEGKNQDELERFVYVGIQKMSKISLAFLRLYEQVDDSEDLEFSLGILSRSIMMDMILMMEIHKLTIEVNETNYIEVKEKLKEYCVKVISDGTLNLINHVQESDSISSIEKNEISKKLANNFPNNFEFVNDKPKRKKGSKISHKEIYNNNKDFDIEISKIVYNLYEFYSKYDHFSHWTSLFDYIEFSERKGKLDCSILLMGIYLERLLTMAYNFAEGYKDLLPFIVDLRVQTDINFKS